MFSVTCDGNELTFNNPNNAVNVYVSICKDRGLNYEGLPFLNENGVLISLINEHDIVNVGYKPDK